MTTNKQTTTERGWGLTSFALHILAMALMLCDHLWATVIPGNAWLTWLGRIAYPIFAFMIAEGYAHTRSRKKYILRMLCFALLAELPFNLMYTSLWIYPFHQNVLWTFILALLALCAMDAIRAKLSGTRPKALLGQALAWAAGLLICLAAQLLMTDYGFWGALTVLIFSHLRGRDWWKRALLVLLIGYINIAGISGLEIPLALFGRTWVLPQQGFAILSLIPIFLYNGRPGPSNRFIRLLNYFFYPAHMLVLGLLMMIL